jgi:hypothetical protein
MTLNYNYFSTANNSDEKNDDNFFKKEKHQIDYQRKKIIKMTKKLITKHQLSSFPLATSIQK